MNQETLENGNTLRSLRVRQATKASKYKLKRQWQKIAAEALARKDQKIQAKLATHHNRKNLLFSRCYSHRGQMGL